MLRMSENIGGLTVATPEATGGNSPTDLRESSMPLVKVVVRSALRYR
jgi:hypothetical protein